MSHRTVTLLALTVILGLSLTVPACKSEKNTTVYQVVSGTPGTFPGTIVELRVRPGDRVERGRPLLVLEAMKMRNDVLATASGTVAEIVVEPGHVVAKGDLLVRLAD